MTISKPSARAISVAEQRAENLPEAQGDRYPDLEDPLKRFTAIAELDEWSGGFGYTLSPDPQLELEKLRPLVTATEVVRSPRPTSGVLADELARIDEAIRELGEDPEEEPPSDSSDEDADILEALARLTLTYSDPQDLNVRNLKRFADRLGYTVTR